MSAMKPPVKVEPGQIWADKDRRRIGRKVRVVEINVREAVVEIVWSQPGVFVPNGRRSRVLYDHRGLRGYRLITDAKDGT